MWGRGWAGLFLVHSEFGGWGGGSHALGQAGSALQGRLFTPSLNPRSMFGAGRKTQDHVWRAQCAQGGGEQSQDSPLLVMSDPVGFKNYSDELFQ